MKGRSKTPLSLIEITVMILVFSVCAAVCMKLFVSAGEKARFSGDLSRAAALAQTAADTYRACGGDLEETGARLPADCRDGVLTLWLDEDWQACGAAEGAFCLTLADGDTAAISVRGADGGELFALEVKAVPYG